MVVSFIIPYHNEPLWMLHECLDSIFALSLSDQERDVIIVDDGSEVSPASHLERYGKTVRYVRQENQGPSVARNHALDIAHGDYLQFIDSDDRIIPSVYNQLLDFIRVKPEVDILMFRFTTNEQEADQLRIHETQDLTLQEQAISGSDFLCRYNLRAAMWGYIFKKETLGNLRFKPGIFHEDTLFTPLLMLQTRHLVSVFQKAYFYRQHSGTTMSNRTPSHIQKRLNDALTVLRCYREEMEKAAGTKREAWERAMHQQVMNDLYMTYEMLRSTKSLFRRAKELKADNFFPLPLKRYTWKYWSFACITQLVNPFVRPKNHTTT